MDRAKPRPKYLSREQASFPPFAGKWPRSAGFTPVDEARTAIAPSHTPREEVGAPRPRGAFVHGSAVARQPSAYSGTAIGLATMHKSNTVPVWDEETAREIARMRR